jgi:hypothetical protein
MHANVTLSRSLLARAVLASAAYQPGPDDDGDPNNPFGPYGPHGPVLNPGVLVALNPQPLPPRAVTAIQGRLRSDPMPITIARAILGHAISLYEVAEVLGAAHVEKTLAAVRSQLDRVIDDWCGTKPPRPPFPHPRAHALWLLRAGAEMQVTADALGDHALSSTFAAGADKLMQTGLRQLEELA